jgi:hypothetical protein
MAEMTIEQQRILAMAAARKRQAEGGGASAPTPTAVDKGEWVTPGQGEKTVLSNVPLAGPAIDAVSEFTRSLYPVEKNTETGELRPAVPKIIPAIGQGIADAFTLPGDVAQGRVDPLSEEGVNRGVGFAATFGAGGLKGAVQPPVSPFAKSAARALKDDKLTATGLPAALENLGTDAMVMDLGPNLQRQAGALASIPGEAQKTIRDAVTERAKGASTRVADDVAQTVGSSPDLFTLQNDLVAAQKAAADPLYAAVRDVPIQMPPALAFIGTTPLGKAAFAKARELAANDGYTTNGVTVGLVDYAKQALDDIAASAAREGKGNIARQARNMTKAITSATDAQVPGYKQAREAFAGPARVMEAIEEGQAALTKDMSPSQLKSQMASMSPSEQDAFLAGVQGSVEAAMGNAVNDPLALRNMFRKGWNQAKLRTLLGDELTEDLLKRIDREVTFGKTENVVAGNSETAARQAAQREIDPQQKPVAQPTVIGLVLSAINKARSGVRAKTQPKVNSDLAAFLKANGSSWDPSQISEVQRAMQPQPFLPSGMRDLTRVGVLSQPSGTVEDQLAAYGFLQGPRT